MKERPILFSGAMVSAILDGTKTQTRRVVKPQPYIDEMGNACWNGLNFGQSADKVPHFQSLASPIPSSKTKRVHCPYGKPGDRLWVRETWARDSEDDALFYRADVGSGNEADDWQRNIDDGANGYRWRPSIHMPRWASRITLEVTGVRVERLQEISGSDAVAEGVRSRLPDNGIAVAEYRDLWEAINGAESWSANPWVWVIEFEVVK